MAPTSPLSSGRHMLSARGVSPGTVAGATVGAIIGAAIVLICTLPFILKAIRKRRARRDAFDPYEAYAGAEMGMVVSVPVSPASPLPPRHFPSDEQFGPILGPPSHPGLPPKEREANGLLPQYNGVSHPAHGSGPFPPAALPQSIPLPVSPASPAPFPALPPAPLAGWPGRPSPPQTGPSTPWEATPEGQAALRSSPFGPATMTSEPEAMEGEVSRGPTELKRSDSSGLGDAVRRFARRTSEALRRGSTRSSGGDPSFARSPADINMTIGPAYAASPTAAVYSTWDDIPMGGASAEYYSGAPLSPPEEDGYAAAGAGAPYAPAGQPAHKALPPGAQYQHTRSPEQLGMPFAPPQGNVGPLTPGSTGPKSEVSSDEDVATRASPIPLTDLPPAKAAAKPPSSPLHPAPGTVNPMDIMKPSNSTEKDWMVTAELEAIRNSPPGQVPQFTAVVRQPTQTDMGRDSQGSTQPDQSMSDYSTPPPDIYSGASDENTPDTRLTEPAPHFTDSLSPASSQNPSTPSTLRDDQSPGASPRSYRCKECDRAFDQIHKLNHHKRYHDRPHECPHCDKRFGTKTHLDRHVNDKHMKTKKYHCTVQACPYSRQGGKSFPRKDNWRRHMMNKHSVTPDYDPPEASDERERSDLPLLEGK